ncbi:MAG: nuclear transport factor 2 family protein [bacterium]|nr:nuclear transport factor 2 family protein [bacterium]
MSDSTFMTFEAIKQLKARYFRLIDTQQWDGLKEVFTEDATLKWGPLDEQIMRGRDAILAGLIANLEGASTVHHGHMPEIELIDETHAKAIWAMFDRVDHPQYLLTGFGHYHEDYVKEEGAWRIQRLHLVRLHEDRQPKR